jgi:hypothetical protein
MPIQYGDLTIVYTKPATGFFASWFPSCTANATTKHVFLFEDGDICEAKYRLVDFQYSFLTSCVSSVPPYFEKLQTDTTRRIYFHKTTDKNEDTIAVDTTSVYSRPTMDLHVFTNLFQSYSKYNRDICIQSKYNSIYYCYRMSLEPEIFGIVRIKSSDDMPRYQFAYDTGEFTKDEIVYILYRIFNPMAYM